MTSPYPPYQAPKRLERSRDNKVVAGVCAGTANYLNMDPTLVRVLTVALTVFTGAPPLLYFVAMFLMPEESPRSPGEIRPPAAPPQDWTRGYASAPYQQPSPAPDPVWGPAGPPWQQPYPGDPNAGPTGTRPVDGGPEPGSHRG